MNEKINIFAFDRSVMDPYGIMAMLGFLVFLFYLIYNYLNASGNAGRSGRKISSHFSNFKLSNLTTRVLDALIRNNQKYEL